ncbi:MAG: HD domain-containing protein [Solirubrobacteraceae bacterium]
MPVQAERRTAVIDMGSNSFRLVVFSVGQHWWKRTDEIYDTVRLGEGLSDHDRLVPERAEQALEVMAVYAHFCEATGIRDVRPVATSAIRDAADGSRLVARVRAATGLRPDVLSREREAWFGYLAAVNSTSLADGLVLDLGGGSMQLVSVAGRRRVEAGSWPLGTLRMTERFLPGKTSGKKPRAALRRHVRDELAAAGWVAGDRLVGLGGTVRNLAAAAQRRAGLPSLGVQGFELQRTMLDELVDELASRAPSKRAGVAGIKPGRSSIILAGAVALQGAMDVASAECIEVTEAGLREGVFFESHLAAATGPPLLADVRAASVRNLAAQYQEDLTHPEHVARIAGALLDSLGEPDPAVRELLWAAAMLHDIGMAVDYDDHHKHSRYLVLAAGLPGWRPRELALIAQAVRYHRKGNPELGDLAPLARPGDEELLVRMAALLRLAEHLDRARDGVVEHAQLVACGHGAMRLELRARGNAALARWSTERQGELFERAFGCALAGVS